MTRCPGNVTFVTVCRRPVHHLHGGSIGSALLIIYQRRISTGKYFLPSKAIYCNYEKIFHRRDRRNYRLFFAGFR